MPCFLLFSNTIFQLHSRSSYDLSPRVNVVVWRNAKPDSLTTIVYGLYLSFILLGISPISLTLVQFGGEPSKSSNTSRLWAGGGGGSSSRPSTTPTTTTNPVGCLAGYLFSPLTGARCPTTTVSGSAGAGTSTATGTVTIYFTKPTNTADRATVRNLQTVLNRALGLTLKVDGIYGPASLAAVKAFQARNGLVADGKIGDLTRAKLNLVYP